MKSILIDRNGFILNKEVMDGARIVSIVDRFQRVSPFNSDEASSIREKLITFEIVCMTRFGIAIFVEFNRDE